MSNTNRSTEINSKEKTPRIIFTMNARENVFLEVMKGHFGLPENKVYEEIQWLFDSMLDTLSQKNINYADLKSALIPHGDRSEIALVFDSGLIKSDMYGYEVFAQVLPLLRKNNCISILCGDYIGKEQNESLLKHLFNLNIHAHKQINYVHSELFFIVYMNNLTKTDFLYLDARLRDYGPYVGYFDLTYSSPIKTYLSTILIRLCIKDRATIIAENPENEDVNMSGYPFEKNGFEFKGVDSLPYQLFLSYKIEREVFRDDKTDTFFSLNSITTAIHDICGFEILIAEDKLKYLMTQKVGILKRAGIDKLSIVEFQELIKGQIANNYIYQLSFLTESNTVRFNIIIQVHKLDTIKPMKLTVALEYMAEQKILRVITIF